MRLQGALAAVYQIDPFLTHKEALVVVYQIDTFLTHKKALAIVYQIDVFLNHKQNGLTLWNLQFGFVHHPLDNVLCIHH